MVIGFFAIFVTLILFFFATQVRVFAQKGAETAQTTTKEITREGGNLVETISRTGQGILKSVSISQPITENFGIEPITTRIETEPLIVSSKNVTQKLEEILRLEKPFDFAVTTSSRAFLETKKKYNDKFNQQLKDAGIEVKDARDLSGLSPEEAKDRRLEIEMALPQDIKHNTSLAGAEQRQGVQFKRGSEVFEEKLAEEQARAEAIFAALYGNVHNPNFGGN